jgi:hypothetical protein
MTKEEEQIQRLIEALMREKAEIKRLREALKRIETYVPAITHAWADDVRTIARSALYDQTIMEDAR